MEYLAHSIVGLILLGFIIGFCASHKKINELINPTLAHRFYTGILISVISLCLFMLILVPCTCAIIVSTVIVDVQFLIIPFIIGLTAILVLAMVPVVVHHTEDGRINLNLTPDHAV